MKGASFTLSPTVTDATIFQWVKVSGPGNVLFSSPQTKDSDVSADADGVYVIRLTVTDAEGSSATDELSFTWQTTPPSVNAGADTCSGVNSQKLLNATTSGASTYAWTRTSGSGQCTISTPNAEDTQVSCDAVGNHTFTLTATNALGVSANDSVVLDVKGSGSIDCMGIVTLPQPSGAHVSMGGHILQQPDGKFVVSGSTFFLGFGLYSVLYRMTPDGALDTSFGDNGIAFYQTPVTALPSGSIPSFERAVDGKFYVGSSTYSNHHDLIRYNTDGTIDTSYGINGRFELSFSAETHWDQVLAMQSDGKLVLAGAYQPAPVISSDVGLVRWEAGSTTPDSTFGSNGVFSVSVLTTNQVTRLKVLSDGKLLMMGRSIIGASHFSLMTRLTTSGAYDTSFNGTGFLTFDLVPQGYGGTPHGIHDAVVLPDGKIVIAGVATHGISGVSYLFLGRLNGDGAWDTSFATGGMLITNIEVIGSIPLRLFLQGDEKLVVTYPSTSGLFSAGVARFNSNGTLDPSFGTNGITIVSDFISGYSAIMDSNGDFVLTGSVGTTTQVPAWVKVLK